MTTTERSWKLIFGCLLSLSALSIGIFSRSYPLSVAASVSSWASSRILLDSPGASAFASWASGADFSDVFSLHFFNVTSPEDFIAGGLPTLVAVPPLLVRRREARVNASWSAGGSRVAFSPIETFWEYSDSASESSAGSDVITTLYMPGYLLLMHENALVRSLNAALGGTPFESAPAPARAAVLAGLSRLDRAILGACAELEGAGDASACGLSPRELRAAQRLRSRLATGESLLFSARPLVDLAFGFDDEIFEAFHDLDARFPPRFPGFFHNATLAELQDAKSGASPMSVFLADILGRSEVFTGAPVPAAVGNSVQLQEDPRARSFSQWNAMSTLECCASGPCGALGRAIGNDALPAWDLPRANSNFGPPPEQWAPGVVRGSSLARFSKTALRPIALENKNGATVSISGVEALRFFIADDTFSPASAVPANAVFNQFGDEGLLNGSSCAPFKAPIFYSNPYFLFGNESLNARAGIPLGDPEKHESFFDVEPVTGTLLIAQDKWQFNIFVSPINDAGGGSLFPYLKSLYLPVFWVSNEKTVNSGFFRSFQENVAVPTARANAVAIGGGSIATIFAASALVLLVSHFMSKLSAARAAADVNNDRSLNRGTRPSRGNRYGNGLWELLSGGRSSGRVARPGLQVSLLEEERMQRLSSVIEEVDEGESAENESTLEGSSDDGSLTVSRCSQDESSSVEGEQTDKRDLASAQLAAAPLTARLAGLWGPAGKGAF